jgi:hypothetical protein
MENVIPSNQPPVTTPLGSEQPVGDDPIQPEGTIEAELDPKTKEGFQRLVAQRELAAKAEKERAEKAEAELAEYRKAQKAQKLQELDESERLKIERDEALAENAKLRISNFASRELNKRKIDPTDPIYDIVVEAPWALPVIKRSLGDSPSWAEVIQVIEDKLPAYLDTLASRQGETINDAPNPVAPSEPPANPSGADPERPSNPPSKRVWSRKEIGKMSDADYLKHQVEIKKAQAEGRIVD